MLGPATDPVVGNALDYFKDSAREAAGYGVRSFWFAQGFEHDAVMSAALVGQAVPELEVGTAVTPIYPRHPMLLASQAQTAQAATHGRFTLAIGFAVKAWADNIYGTPWDRPIRHLREYLEILHSLFHEGTVDVQGETVQARSLFPGKVPGADPAVPVIVAAMGPQAMRVAGELADGTMPFLATPKVLADFIVPTMTKAAAGRPDRPRIMVIVPAIVTADPDRKRATMKRVMAIYNDIPSYRTVMDRGGASGPADVGVFGDEEFVAQRIRSYFDAGATDVIVSDMGFATPEEHKRTWQLAGELAQS